METPAPPGVRQIVVALTGRAVERCHRLGLEPDEFYAAVLAERRMDRRSSITEFYARAFRRALRERN